MAYDEELANRIREVMQDRNDVTEKKMFGGLAFLINGNMSVSAVSKGGLLLRVEPSETDELIKRPHAERFEMRSKELNGWLHIHAEGIRTMRDLKWWVNRSCKYAESLPKK